MFDETWRVLETLFDVAAPLLQVVSLSRVDYQTTLKLTCWYTPRRKSGVCGTNARRPIILETVLVLIFDETWRVLETVFDVAAPLLQVDWTTNETTHVLYSPSE